MGFKLTDRGIPRAGYEIESNGEVVGTVTSGSMSPLLGIGIGMGYVPVELAEPGNTIQIRVRNKTLNATIVRPPFIEK